MEYRKKELDDLMRFMEEYTLFFEQLAAQEADKREALVSNKMPQLERCLSQQQAAVMQMGNLEKEREALLAKAGLSGKTFREIAGGLEGEERSACEAVFNRMEQAVQSIKFSNEKSMAIAQDKLRILAEILPEAKKRESYTPYGRKGPDAGRRVFESKI